MHRESPNLLKLQRLAGIKLTETAHVSDNQLLGLRPIIGTGIIEAIDWSQDHLLGTRPEAERALFKLIQDKIIVEREDGFAYAEDQDQDEVLKKLKKAAVPYHVRPGNGARRGMSARMRVYHASTLADRKQRLLDKGVAADSDELGEQAALDHGGIGRINNEIIPVDDFEAMANDRSTVANHPELVPKPPDADKSRFGDVPFVAKKK